MHLDWEPQAGEALPEWARDPRTVLRGVPLSRRIDRARWAALAVVVAGMALVALAFAVVVWRLV